MKDLVFLQVCPIDLYFHWQTEVQLTNFRKFGYDKMAHVLVFISFDKIPLGIPSIWKDLEKKFPDTKFFYFEDTKNITGTFIRTFNYIPLIRPYCLGLHFKNHPELQGKAVFYHDADIIFTKELDFSPFLSDDTCYISNTKGYIAASYFDSKIKDVKVEALELYKTIDVLQVCTEMFGIDRKTAEENEDKSGGAQYLLKNIDHKFWNKVFDGCIMLRSYLQKVNEHFFEGKTPQEREDKGFQRWCADMWAVLYTLWARGQKTKCPKELDFAWATSPISLWEDVYIFHNAGATPQTSHLFYKASPALVNNIETPFHHDFSYVSPDYCSFNYTKEILNTK